MYRSFFSPSKAGVFVDVYTHARGINTRHIRQQVCRTAGQRDGSRGGMGEREKDTRNYFVDLFFRILTVVILFFVVGRVDWKHRKLFHFFQ